MAKALALLGIVAAGVLAYFVFLYEPVEAPGGPYSGTIKFNVVGGDNTGIVRVEIYLNDSLMTTHNVTPTTNYSQEFSIDTTTFPNGSYNLYAKGHDAHGNVGTSQTINLTFNNEPAGNASSRTTDVGTLNF